MTPPERLQDVLSAMRSASQQCAMFADRIEAAAALSVRGWQPIESAPKDGSDVLVCTASAPEPKADLAHWDKSYGWIACSRDTYVSTCADADSIGVYESATHWQPLPATPPSEG